MDRSPYTPPKSYLGGFSSSPAPASHVRRLAAYVVDQVIVWFAIGIAALLSIIPMAAIHGATSVVSGEADPAGNPETVLVGGMLLMGWLGAMALETMCITSRWRGTLGKRLLGLHIVRADDGPLSFGQALMRSAGRSIALHIFPYAFVIGVLSPDRRQLWDMVCGTRVIRAE